MKTENENKYIPFGVSRTYCRITKLNNLNAVEISTGIECEKRLQVFMSKAVNAISYVETEVDSMGDDEVDKFLKERDRLILLNEKLSSKNNP